MVLIKRLSQFRHLESVLIALMTVAAFSLVFIRPGIMETFERTLYDQYMQLRGSIPTEQKIVIATIDDRSLAEIGRWPWSRDKMATMIEHILGHYKAKVIGFDITFSEPQRNPLKESIDILMQKEGASHKMATHLRAYRALGDVDAKLEQVMKQYHDRIVSGYFFYAGNPPKLAKQRLPAQQSMLLPFALASARKDAMAWLPHMEGLETNIPRFTRATDASGFFNFFPDPDGIVRRTPLIAAMNQRIYPSMALQTMRKAAGNPPVSVQIDRTGVHAIQIGTQIVHTDPHGLMLINHYGKAGTFQHISAVDILHNRADPEALRDAIVLIGVTAIGIYDIRPSPFDAYFPGIEGHAATIANLLNHEEIYRPALMDVLESFGLLTLALVAAFTVRKRPPLVQGMTIAAFPLLLIISAFLLFVYEHIWFKVAYLLVACLITTIPVSLTEYILESRRRSFIHNAFEHYLSPGVIRELIDKPDMLKLGGEERHMTAMFSDIANFSSFSEKMNPKELVQFLNMYLTAMSDIILKHGGTIDKYEGDAVIAFFGAPVVMEDHAKRAVLAALEQQEQLAKLRKVWRGKGLPAIHIRLGLNSGPMIVGNMGTSTRMDYTMMGDHVNLAARLESIGKFYQLPILISHHTYALIHAEIMCRFVDRVRVVGRDHPVDIYQPLAPLRDIANDAIEADSSYQQAWQTAMVARDFHAAWHAIATLKARYPDDPLYSVMSKRIEQLRDNPPAASWDGVFNLRRK